MSETRKTPNLNAAGWVAAFALVFAPIVQLLLAGNRSWPYWLWFFGGFAVFALLNELGLFGQRTDRSTNSSESTS